MNEGDALIAFVRGVHARTAEVGELLTEELVGWRPREGESTVGEVVAHIAASRAMNAMSLAEGSGVYRPVELSDGGGAAELRELLRTSSADCLARLGGVDFEREVRTISGAVVPGWRLVISGLVEHEVHHRSQLCEYLSANGGTPPPLFGLHTEGLTRG